MQSRDFYFELCDLLNSINNKYDEYAKRSGIVSNNLFWLFYALNDDKPHTQLDLSEHCSLPKTTVNTIIKELEKQGIVSMVKDNDKRKKLVSFTKEGKKYANNLLKDLFSKEDMIFNANKEELIALIEKLNKFNELLNILKN